LPLSINLDASPYWDDYYTEAQANGYYKILFKPTTAVQARELTQIQSILQDQIEKFGNWSFKSGDIVYGCAVNDIPVLPFAYLSDFQSNGYVYATSNLAGTVAISAANLQAMVLSTSQGLQANYPNTSVVYVQYLNTGTDGSTTYSNTDVLTFVSTNTGGNTTVAIVNTFQNAAANQVSTGNAHGLSVSDGVIFIDGVFVALTNTIFAIVNAYGTDAANNVVGFQLNQNIVTAAQDQNLNDGSQGFSNFNAPGADRLQLVPELITLQANQVANTDKFTAIATFSDGSLATAAGQFDINSVLGQAIAERTFDTSGNFVVNPFPVGTVTVTTANSVVQFPNPNTFLATIGPGVGFAGGELVKIQKMAYVNVPVANATASQVNAVTTFNYGSYFQLQEVAGTFPIQNGGIVYLYDTPQQCVTNYNFGCVGAPTGNVIGNACCRCFTYNNGTPGTNSCQYFLHIYNPQMANGYSINQVQCCYANSGGANGCADLAQPGLQGQTDDLQMFSFGANCVASLRDANNNNNTQYVYKRAANATMQTNGQVVVTLTTSTPGGTDFLPFPPGVLTQQQAGQINLIGLANVDSATQTGTVVANSATVNVIGTSTTFTTIFAPGDQIRCNGNTTVRTVVTVVNNTFLTVDTAWPVTGTAQTFVKTYAAGKIIPIINGTSTTGPQGYVTVTNSTSMAINSGQIPNTALNCTVIFDVLRTGVTPAKKVINKGRFVKIDTTQGNPRGPWCLGFSDIHQLTGVWACKSNTSYSQSGIDVLPYFSCDYGATDTHYRQGTLHCTGFDCTQAPYLLCQVDYFSCNTTPGYGVYTCESYPIDDSNTANITAITTANVPCYVDSNRHQHNCRDHCDFRPACNPTANDTGHCDHNSNSSVVANCISAASTNPANTIVIPLPSSNNVMPPSFSQSLQASVTYYLPRADVVYMMPDNTVHVQTGSPSTNATPEKIPHHALALASLYVAPYPSLAMDQLDALTDINNNSFNVNRDTSTAVVAQLTQQRRYTMQDIGELDDRVTTLENFIALNWVEQQATSQVIVNANGDPQMKSGIFVESFANFSSCDTSNPEFSCAVDCDHQTCRPSLLTEYVNLQPNNLVNIQQTGRCLTLPYTEVAILAQNCASSSRSCAPKTYAWCGNIKTYCQWSPRFDQCNTGSISVSTANNAGRPPTQSGYSSVSGWWRTSSNNSSSAPRVAAQKSPSPQYNQTVDTTTIYSAATSNPSNPPQYYVQAHQSLASNSSSFSPPASPLNSSKTKSNPSFGARGHGVVNSVPYSRN